MPLVGGPPRAATTASRAPPNSVGGGRRRARTSGDPLDKPSSAMTLYSSLSLSKPLASRIGARTLRNLDGGLGKMNSNSGKELRTNARCRTPFSNSLHADHNRSTTGLYSPRDAPTTHSTPYFTGTGAPAPPRARTRSDAHSPRTRRCGAQCGASTASTSARPTRITPRLPPPDRPYDHGSDRAHDHLRVLHAHTRTGHTRRPRAQSTRLAHTHHALVRTHAARHEHTHTPLP